MGRGNTSAVTKVAVAVMMLAVTVFVVLGIIWSMEPDTWDAEQRAKAAAEAHGHNPVTGYTTTNTLIELASILLDKPGGYITNDLTPPGVIMDNMPNWEFGVLVQVRDMSRALRKDIARSQSTSAEDADLSRAEPQFNFDSESYMFPSTESEYRKGIKLLKSYQNRLAGKGKTSAQFYARADNLRQWLSDVETRLGSLSQRLSASVGKDQVSSMADPKLINQAHEENVKTPFFQIDDIFYEARGSAYALLHLLKAIKHDFADVLENKNAMVSLQQIIRELEASQQTVYSPMILNGSGFGVLANHSLVMANYISRVNAAIIDLRELLSQG